MKLEEGENIQWIEDNEVDHSRKRRVHTNSVISGKRTMFSPEDLTVETDLWDGNPSVNKKSWPVSEYFDDDLNHRDYLLNRGRNSRVRHRLRRFFEDDDLDITLEVRGD